MPTPAPVVGDVVETQSQLLADPHRIGGDCAMLARATRHGWDIPAATRRAAVERMDAIVRRTAVTVATMNGPVEDEGTADRHAVAAARVLTAMAGQEQADAHHADNLEVARANAVSAAAQAGLVKKVYLGLDPEQV